MALFRRGARNIAAASLVPWGHDSDTHHCNDDAIPPQRLLGRGELNFPAHPLGRSDECRFNVQRLRREQLQFPPGFLTVASSPPRLKREELHFPPGMLGTTPINRPTRAQIFSGVGSDFLSIEDGDSELFDGATNDGGWDWPEEGTGTLAPLHDKGRQNGKRKRSSNASATAQSNQPRKKARYNLRKNGFPALTSSEVPAGIDACVGETPFLTTLPCGQEHPLCRLAGCDKTQCTKLGFGSRKDFFCIRCYNKHTTNQEELDRIASRHPIANLADDGFPELALSEVPEGIDACVGKTPLWMDVWNDKEKTVMKRKPLCRLAGCSKTQCRSRGRGPSKDYFCRRCFTERTGGKKNTNLKGDGFPELALSEVPEGIDACVGKTPLWMTVGQGDVKAVCRLAECSETQCTKQGCGPSNDYFCRACYRNFAYDQSQWTRSRRDPPWDGKAFPDLVHTVVPAEVDANVGNAPLRNEDGLVLCRLAGCDRVKCPNLGFRCKEYFCFGCYSRYSKVNQLYSEKIAKRHDEKVKAGDTIDTTLRQHLLDQSFDVETDGDADVHMANDSLLFHFSAAPTLDHWECNNAGEIQLKPNKYLKRETLDQHTPHWKKMPGWKREKADPKVWATTNFLGGWKFIAGHHMCPPKKGTVWHVFVITPKNGAYKTFSQFRWNLVNVSRGHECMVESVGRDLVPCFVLRLEFTDADIENAEMTVVRVNGDGATEEKISAEDPRFKITEENISWHK